MEQCLLRVKKGLKSSFLFLTLIGLLISANTAFAAAPTFSDASTADENSDRTVDKIIINFSEPVDIIDGNAGNGFDSISLTDGCTIPNGDYAASSVTTLELTGLTGCTALDDSITPTVTFSAVVDCSTEGAICDTATTSQMANSESVVSTDGISPVITGANTSIDDSSCTGNSGECIVGDTVSFYWDAVADGNTDVTTPSNVAFTLFGFGGGASEVADGVDGSGVFYIDWVIPEEDDDGSFSFGVSATDDSGLNSTGPIASTSFADVDNIKPIVTQANVTIVDFCGGVCTPGADIDFYWDNTAGGDNNTDVTQLSQVDFNVSNLGGSTNATPDDASGGLYSYTYTLVSGNVDGTYDYSISVRDDAGNETVQSSLDTVSIDTENPRLTSLNLTLDNSACTGTGLICLAGDTVTAYWDNSPGGDNNFDVSLSDVIFNLSAFGLPSNVNPDDDTGGLISYSFTVPVGNIDSDRGFSSSVSDDAGLSTVGIVSSNTILVDNETPTMTGANLTIDDSLCTGNSGECIIGDTVVFIWDASADGNSDILDPLDVFFDLSEFGGLSSENPDSCALSVCTLSFSVVADDDDGLAIFYASAYDDAGNFVGPVTSTDTALIDNVPPVVTPFWVDFDSTGCPGGVCVEGDTLIFHWDNTVLGQNNSDSISSVEFDLSDFGGSLSQLASESADFFSYSLLISSGNNDGDFPFTATVFDDAGNSVSAVSSNSQLIDNESPQLNAGNMEVDDSACSGPSNECLLGDDITFTWDNSAGTGDDNSDVDQLSYVAFDLSDFGGASDQNPSSMVGDIFSYTLTLSDPSIDGIFSFDVTVEDDVGNTEGPISSVEQATVDTEVPLMTAGNLTIDVSGCTGTAGICIAADTMVFAWDSASEGNSDVLNLSDVDFDLTNFGEGIVNPDTFSGGVFSKSITLAPGSIDTGASTLTFSASAQDDVLNTVGPVVSSGEAAVDNDIPIVTDTCISVSGATGIGGAIKYGDIPSFSWDNNACDSVGDLVSVDFDASQFLATASNIAATETAGIWSVDLPGLPDAQDDTANNVDVIVTDDAGNISATLGIDDVDIDTIVPAFILSNPILARTNDGSASDVNTNKWYYYDPSVSPHDLLRLTVFNELEADGNFLNVKVCLRSLKEDAPSQTCTGGDFDVVGNYATASVNPGFASSNLIYDLSSLTSWPTTVDGFSMNVRLMDDVGNITDSSNADEMFTAILNVEPKEIDSTIDNATTTDWYNIDDFTNVPSGTIVFNADDGLGNDIARMTFNEALNLTDDATIQGLSNFATNVTTSNDVIRLDSSALSAFNVDTEVMVVMDSGEQPGFVVKDNDGVVVGTIPSDAGVGPYDVDGLSGSHEASNFTWNSVNKTLTFDVTGFSEYDSDNTVPTVSYSPISGATGVAINTPLVLTFNEAVDTSSFTYTVTPDPGSLSVVWSAGDTVATISHANFANSTSYTVEISTATDKVGNSLVLPSSSSFSTVAVASSSGGGGGGSSFIIGATSSAGSTTPVSISSPVSGTRSLERSIDINDSMLEEVEVDGETMLTGEITSEKGNIELSNDDMTVKIGPNTEVSAESNWNGVIAPPTIVSLEKVLSGDKLKVVDGEDIPSDNIEFVLKIGSDNSKLYFNPAISVEIPVNLPNGTVVQVLVSNDGSEFETLQTVTVVDGKLVFETTHLSYFAFATESNIILFPDLEGHWAKDYVITLYNDGVVNGKADGKFEPDANITRAELTKIALLGFNYSVSETVSTMPFSDISVDAWFAPYVEKAKELSIVSGYADNLFKPSANITRAEALKILAKAGVFDPSTYTESVEFTDVSSDDWYYEYVRMANQMGVVNGYSDNSFRPNAYITRAEASKILLKLMEN